MVRQFIDNGSIGQDSNGNAVFKIFDSDGNLSGAEISGTISEKRYKQNTERGGNGFTVSVNPEAEPKRILFFESAIDTLSFYNILKRIKSNEFDNYLLVSMGGLKDKVIDITEKNFIDKYGKTPICCISADNDEAGIKFSEKQTEKGYKAIYIKNTPAYKEVIKNFPDDKIKDWNDLLQNQNKLIQLYEKSRDLKNRLKDMILADEKVINAAVNSQRQEITLEVTDALNKYTLQILNDNISENSDFYNNFTDDSRQKLIENIVDTILQNKERYLSEQKADDTAKKEDELNAVNEYFNNHVEEMLYPSFAFDEKAAVTDEFFNYEHAWHNVDKGISELAERYRNGEDIRNDLAKFFLNTTVNQTNILWKMNGIDGFDDFTLHHNDNEVVLRCTAGSKSFTLEQVGEIQLNYLKDTFREIQLHRADEYPEIKDEVDKLIERMEKGFDNGISETLNNDEISVGTKIYKAGDTIQIEGTEYIIENINNIDVTLRDTSLIYPILRVENKENFKRLVSKEEDKIVHTAKTDVSENMAEYTIDDYMKSGSINHISDNDNNIQAEQYSENNKKMTAEQLKIGDVIKLPPITFTYSNGKEKTFPSEYGVVTNIQNNMISFQTYSDKELQNRISRTGQTISMLNENGFEYIGTEEEIKQGAVQTEKAAENGQQADNNLSLISEKSEIAEALENGKTIRLKDTPVPIIADARANYFSNQKLSKEIDGNFILKGKVSKGLGTPQDFEFSFENAEKAEKYITSHNLEYYIENSEQNIEDEKEYRYEVTQTSDAYDAGENFAVWDNEKNDYYFDENGTIKTFETEEETASYISTLNNYTLSDEVIKENDDFQPQNIINAVEKILENHSFSNEERLIITRAGSRMTANNDNILKESLFDDDTFKSRYGGFENINKRYFNNNLKDIISEFNSYLNENTSDKNIPKK